MNHYRNKKKEYEKNDTSIIFENKFIFQSKN